MAEKKNKQKSLLATMREVDQREAQQEAEREARQKQLAQEKEAAEKEHYDKEIQQDKIELIRLKQGVIQESDRIYEQKEEKKKLPFWKRIGNFFYHNLWWLGITVVLGGIFGFLIVDYALKVRPDLVVLVLTENDEIQTHIPQIEAYITQFTDDVNKDKRVKVNVYALPVTDDIGENDYYTGYATSIMTQFQMADAILILSDTKANAYIMAEENLVNMEELYPEEENARGQGYYLRHTDFAEKIECTKNVKRDLCFGMRTPRKTYDSLEKMQKNYAIAETVLERIMEDLDGTQEAFTEPESAE